MQCNAKQFGGCEDLEELGGFGDLGEPGPRVWGTRLEISNELDTSVDAPGAPRPGGTGPNESRHNSPGIWKRIRTPIGKYRQAYLGKKDFVVLILYQYEKMMCFKNQDYIKMQ